MSSSLSSIVSAPPVYGAANNFTSLTAADEREAEKLSERILKNEVSSIGLSQIEMRAIEIAAKKRSGGSSEQAPLIDEPEGKQIESTDETEADKLWDKAAKTQDQHRKYLILTEALEKYTKAYEIFKQSKTLPKKILASHVSITESATKMRWRKQEGWNDYYYCCLLSYIGGLTFPGALYACCKYNLCSTKAWIPTDKIHSLFDQAVAAHEGIIQKIKQENNIQKETNVATVNSTARKILGFAYMSLSTLHSLRDAQNIGLPGGMGCCCCCDSCLLPGGNKSYDIFSKELMKTYFEKAKEWDLGAGTDEDSNKLLGIKFTALDKNMRVID